MTIGAQIELQKILRMRKKKKRRIVKEKQEDGVIARLIIVQ